MKLRGIGVAAIAAILLVAGWLAWRSGHPAAGAPPVSSQIAGSPAATPTATENGNIPGSVNPPGGPLAAASATPIATGSSPSSANAPMATPGLTPPAQQATAAANNIGRAQAMVELEKVHHMIGAYHTLMGQNPVGTNAEIMKALMGGNPRQAMLGPPPGQSLNAKGELVDPWGTPYFFHQLSGDDMEIISAGADKIMGTADDLEIP
jgi:hypothetical protein